MYDQEAWLKKIDDVIEKGPYKDDWNSLRAFRVPEWFQDAKFGIFIHWGAYSVPAFGNEWYPRNMYIQGSPEYEHHLKTYGPHKKFGYKDFIPLFKAEKFDPKEWLDLFAKAGVRYMVPVAEHHDGFQMYDSELSEWNAAQKGPKRNILEELNEAADQKGILHGASTHRIEHWFFLSHGREFESDISDDLKRGDLYWPAMQEGNHHDLFSEPTPTKEFLDDWMIRTCELIDRYHLRILYFDWWIQHSSAKPYLKKIAAYYYNRAAEWGEEVLICYKHDAFMFGSAMVDIERGQFSEIKPFYWQTDTAIARNSWCYTENNDFKSPESLVCDLIDIVAKNGNLLLNVGPKSDGTISPEDQKVLLGIGNWLSINGEGIYGSRPWRFAQEGPTLVQEGQFTDTAEKVFTSEDFRFTQKGEDVYVFALHYPEDGKLCVKTMGISDASHLPKFAGIIQKVEMVGSTEKVLWNRDEEGLHLEGEKIHTSYPVAFKVTLA